MSIVKPKLVVILGPTASGKSALALKLAEKFNGEIVSADSRQIYKEMNIGTNKLSPSTSVASASRRRRHSAQGLFNYCLSEQNNNYCLSDPPKFLLRKNLGGESKTHNISHHLINIVRPDQNFTLAQYQKLAFKTIKDIQKRDKIPFLVGGTGLYIQAVVDNLKIPKVKPNKKLRQKLEKLTAERLLRKLQKLDPTALNFVDIHNKRRLIRALEVCLTTKKPFSQQREKSEKLFDVLQIGIKINQKELQKRIAERTEKMFAAGLVNEVKNLLKKYSPFLPSMTGIGYREIIQYLFLPKRHLKKILPERAVSSISLLPERAKRVEGISQAKQLINLRTCQYAKRQMTWFKKDKRIKWVKNDKKAEKLIKNFL